MTNEAFPFMFPMDEDEEDRCLDLVEEMLDRQYEEELAYLDDAISGFWKRPPRERRLIYEAAEPVFVLEVLFELLPWLDAGDIGPLVPVYLPQEALDPLTGMPVMQETYIGEAPAILGPYWQRMWATDRPEAIRMLRDWAQIRKQEEKKANDQGLDLLPEAV